MTEVQRKISIKKNKLQLSFWDKISHYEIAGFLFFIPSIFIFFHLKDLYFGTTKPFFVGELIFLVIPTILAIVFYKLQSNRLKFKVIQTNLSRQQIDKIIKKVGNELKWYPEKNENNNVFTAKTHPSFFSGSWGEQITILFDNNTLYTNSICNLNKRSSVVSMGRNRKNVRKLILEIEAACTI